MKTTLQSSEVVVADEPIVEVSRDVVRSLKTTALGNARRRVRLCTHSTIEDPLHEMLIVHAKDAYVRPHKHLDKSESVHIIEGEVDVVVFDGKGKVAEVIRMGDYASGLKFYYRMSGSFYHTLLIRSDILVFHETTSGPFRREDTMFASWAPPEDRRQACISFIAKLEQTVSQFSRRERA